MNHTNRKPENQLRDGLSIIEVLTSVVVAMIGVFGVMVLIPFAIKQAQSGLDKDVAVVMARNAYADFEIGGYRFPSNWGVFRGVDGGGNHIVTAYSPFAPADLDGDGVADGVNDPPMIFSIDPLGVAENLSYDAGGDPMWEDPFLYGTFPFNENSVGTAYPQGRATQHVVAAPYPATTDANDFRFTPAMLGTPSGESMELPAARRMFATSDELVFEDAADEFLGPEQVFNVNSSGAPAKRQTVGSISWSAIVVPFKSDPNSINTTRWSYQMFILVYKDRLTASDAGTGTVAEGQMRTIMVKPAGATTNAINLGLNSPVSTVLLQDDLANPVVVEGVINRDDWVMLINRSPNSEPGFDRQVAFYRVVNAVNERDDGVNPVTPAKLTLDGPDFRFNDPALPIAQQLSDTYIVHLKNVVGVYERTFEPEFESIWTTRGE